MPATAMPAATERAHVGREPAREDPAHVLGELPELLVGGRIGVDVALAHAHHSGVQRRVEADRVVLADDELRGASADVDHDGRLRALFASGHRPHERQLGLLLALQHAGVEAEVVANAVGELTPVGGVPHGRGEHRDVPLAFVAVDLRAVLGQRREDAPLGLLREPSRGVHARTQAGHARAPAELPLHGRRRRVRRRRPAAGSSWCRCPPRPRACGRSYWRDTRRSGGRPGPPTSRARDRPEIGDLCYNLSTAAGWSSLVARRAHNPKVAGSNPAPAIWKSPAQAGFFRVRGRPNQARRVPIGYQFFVFAPQLVG